MENEMKIESMYDVNDKIWFFNDADSKFYEGTITEINNWDKWSGFRYEVQHSGNNPINISVQESKLFASKQEIIENCFVGEA